MRCVAIDCHGLIDGLHCANVINVTIKTKFYSVLCMNVPHYVKNDIAFP